ncbi:MAG: hypothetical protein FWC92_08535 [Defluviitaleaceae bacterium]|nr:hypothetical protein [Defluviitaleaceae bacterium]
MRKNIYTKSMIRQPMRTLLLFLLITLASFAFVLRAVEFLSVNRHIQAIAANYRSIGFLIADSELADVSAGADILANSDFIAFEDRRRQLEGILPEGMHTPDNIGMRRGVPMQDQWRFTVSYFYAYINTIPPEHTGATVLWLDITIDDVLVGLPEHAVAGQNAFLRYMLGPDSIGNASPFENLTEGGRYFFRAHFYQRFGNFGMAIPRVGNAGDWLDIVPIDGESLWFIPVDAGETVDFDAHGLSHIPAEAELLRHNHQAVTLQTTVDMTAMPSFQGRGSSMRLSSGRLLNVDDHLNANPVVVVHSAFAYLNNKQLGDTITIAVHENQFVDAAVTGTWVGGGVAEGAVQVTDALVRSTPDDATVYMIELEIVGLYNNFISMGNHYGWGIFYVPDAVIPANITPSPPTRDIPLIQTSWEHGHVAGSWYSFVLECTRLEQSFLTQYREILQEHNLFLVLFQAGAGGFWAAADPIQLIIAFNAIVFAIVLIMVLLLVAFLYLRQRRRDYAIMRALGRPNRRILLQLCISVLLLCVPAAALGSYFAWDFAISESGAILEPFAEMAVAEAINIHDPFNRINAPASIMAAADVNISMLWLVGLICIVVGLLLVTIVAGFVISLRHSVLEQLQGNTVSIKSAKQMNRSASIRDLETPAFSSNNMNLPRLALTKSPGAKQINILRWVFAHITRSAAKTVLGFAIALFFVIALGWMQESIQSTESNLDTLYDTTVVRVDVTPAGSEIMGARLVTGVITRVGAQILQESIYVNQIAAEAIHTFAAILHPNEDGEFPSDWHEIVGLDRTVNAHVNLARGVFDMLLAISNLEYFIAEHYVGLVSDEVTDFVPSIHIEFMEGFEYEHFTFDTPDEPIPIIIPQSLAAERDFAVGDEVFLAYSALNGIYRNFRPANAIVVGIHNEYIFRLGHESSVIIPVAALEELMGWVTFYTNLSATIDTAHNREITLAREDITERMARVATFIRPLEVFFMDEELRVVVGAMGQVLLLLELMYPIVIVLAVVIGAALSMLFMLQVAKNAAIMRVLGATGNKTRFMLCLELLAVCLAGVIVGLIFMIALSWGFGTADLIVVALFYLAGAIIGSIIGAIIVTAKPPLDLLQVRE